MLLASGLDTELNVLKNGVIQEFYPLFIVVVILSLPLIGYLSYTALKEMKSDIKNNALLRKQSANGNTYQRYVIKSITGNLRSEVTLGIAEEGNVIPIRCSDEQVVRMVRDLWEMNPTKYPVIEALIDHSHFVVVSVKGYTLVNKKDIDSKFPEEDTDESQA